MLARSIFRHMQIQTPSGLDLKLERVAARVTQRAIARAMGVGSTRVSHIEALAVVTPDVVARYRAAIDTCVNERTSGTAA